MFATLNHHQPQNRKTEQWQITRAFLVRLAISMHCCANDGGKIFGGKSIFVSRLTTWLLQIYNMKQTTLSLTFPSVLFKFFSSKGKTAMFSCFQTELQVLKMDDTEDIDPFAYKPLKVTKKRISVSPSQNTPNKKQKTGGEVAQRRKSGVKSQKSPRPSQKGPGIVQLFAQMRKTPVKVRRLPSGKLRWVFTEKNNISITASQVCPLCQLPLDLLWSPSLVTSRVHLNDCQVQTTWWSSQ